MAWEGGNISFFLGASSNAGVSEYAVDVNLDGIFDVTTTEHNTTIDGALLMDAIALSILGSAIDNGTYWGKLRVYVNSGQCKDFDLPIYVGNVPPEIRLEPTGSVEPGQVATWSLSTYDSGPDTVTSLDMDWGDGTSSTVSGSFGSAGHMYSLVGFYTVIVTATDEDGTYYEEFTVAVGDVDAPPVDPDPLRIVSAVAQAVQPGQMLLSVQVEVPSQT